MQGIFLKRKFLAIPTHAYLSIKYQIKTPSLNQKSKPMFQPVLKKCQAFSLKLNMPSLCLAETHSLPFIG